jgi:hypothetical protein
MKRLLAAAAALLGIAYFKRKKPAVEQPDPAEELRAKLAQKRVDEEPVPDDVDARRRAVHEQARAQIDELSGE